jgi:thiol:disulfide interchange protein/DsbC/DsbD-like thiol-disulfide interchange protein
MLTLRASDPIEAPSDGASAGVSQPHVTAELIPEITTIEPGKAFDVALHLHMDKDWHTYWINPGDAGMATTITWTLPAGFTAGPIQWPTPEKHETGGLIVYGYGGDVYLLTTITPPKTDLPSHFEFKAKAMWLVCKEECIPGKAELTLPLDSGIMNLRLPVDNSVFFDRARERIPVPATDWKVQAVYDANHLALMFYRKPGDYGIVPRNARFYPEQSNVLGNLDTDNPPAFTTAKGLSDGRSDYFNLPIKLQQNGERPDKLSGVLVSDSPLVGDVKAIYFAEFPVKASIAAAIGATAPNDGSNTGEAQLPGQVRSQVQLGNEGTGGNPGDGHRPPLQQTETAPPLLIAVLGAAFIGGLILNLMPCVLPVLSLKVFSLMKHAGENPKAAWVQGVAFTAGVVLSFWVLAGLLLALRAAGNHLGWGFQMQSPGFVLGLVFLFFLLALNLFGVFELGTSLVGLDAKASNHLGGLASSFGNGALATLAATPCTAPFMGSALGFAAQQPPLISLLIFTFLALGMATPYLLLTLFPGALRFVPKPGAWMEAFKQFMGFLLMATVIFLVYVFGALVGEEQLPWLLFVLLIAGLAAWIYGRWGSPIQAGPVRAAGIAIALAAMGFAVYWGTSLAMTKPEGTAAQRAAATGWQPWSQDAVQKALADGKPVFVDFTAAWCLSCKVNERVALDTDAVKQAFAQKGVVILRGDWTQSDPEISKTLQQYNRDGVPLYLLYSPKAPDAPQVLPEVLTPGIVLDALGKL